MALEEEAQHRNTIKPCTISVLNVVMDYYMSEPTPLEPTEFQMSRAKNKQNNEEKGAFHSKHASMMIQVPVVRIFGPVLRGDQGTLSRNSKRQGGCAHIHNAFPYIICRPASAGMDHNFFNVSTNVNNKSSTHQDIYLENKFDINWNDGDQIEQILDILQSQLEIGMTSYEKTTDDDNNKSSNGKQIKYIRDISIVHGRGFYGYCTGAPCPFVKIRYYNPSHRWKVKAMMESECVLGIKFRCFEAHIVSNEI